MTFFHKINFIVLAALIISSCSTHLDVSNNCKIPNGWLNNKHDMSNKEDYINISVYSISYKSLGYTMSSDSDFADFINKQHDYSRKIGYNLPYIFLRSNKGLECERLQKAARIIEANYPCKESQLCVWAYGLGDKAQPFGIPSAPADKAPQP